MHPLDGAYERIDWARKRFRHLERSVNTFQKSKVDSVVVERKPSRAILPGGQEIGIVLGTAKFPLGLNVPTSVSVLLGEVIYNARSALDYLVYELARFDARHEVEKTQFPIEDSEAVFDNNRRQTYLRGVSDIHVALIKDLQPFRGCNWTKLLRDISNPDKHMHLTFTFAPVSLSLPPGSTEAILAGEPVDMKQGISIEVLFGDGTPVIKSVDQILPNVAKTLDAFKSEFK